MKHVRGWALVLVWISLAACANRTCPPVARCPAPGPSFAPGAAAEDDGVRDAVRMAVRRAVDRLVEGASEADGGRLQVLALSGGGLNGAFGAGVMLGWRQNQASRRPCFDIITGISTGALQAPLVFLDTVEADQALRENFLTAGAEDMFTKRSVLALPWADSLLDDACLVARLRRVVNNRVIDQIAAASLASRCAKRPRSLFVGTSNLDTGVQHMWDITAMARKAAGDPRFYDRIRSVILASASFPVFLSPVMIDGEMHTDGGAREQVLLPNVLEMVEEELRAAAAGFGVDFAEIKDEAERKARQDAQARQFLVQNYPLVTVIVNGEIGLARACTQPHIPGVALRTVELLVDEAMVGNLWRMWGTVQKAIRPGRCDTCFRFLTMPPGILPEKKSSLELTRADMRLLYDRGYGIGRALADNTWMTDPSEVGQRVQGR